MYTSGVEVQVAVMDLPHEVVVEEVDMVSIEFLCLV